MFEEHPGCLTVGTCWAVGRRAEPGIRKDPNREICPSVSLSDSQIQPCSFWVLSHLILITGYQVSFIVIPVLQIRKLRHGKFFVCLFKTFFEEILTALECSALCVARDHAIILFPWDDFHFVLPLFPVLLILFGIFKSMLYNEIITFTLYVFWLLHLLYRVYI